MWHEQKIKEKTNSKDKEKIEENTKKTLTNRWRSDWNCGNSMKEKKESHLIRKPAKKFEVKWFIIELKFVILHAFLLQYELKTNRELNYLIKKLKEKLKEEYID